MTDPTTTEGWESLLGVIPPGTPPAAWWYSIHPDNLAGEQRYRDDMTTWRNPEKAIIVFYGGDPDRIEPSDRRSFTVDETYWSRVPLSVYHLLRERQKAAL